VKTCASAQVCVTEASGAGKPHVGIIARGVGLLAVLLRRFITDV
jgi:hypothetical protein